MTKTSSVILFLLIINSTAFANCIQRGCAPELVGNPVNIVNGNKYEAVTDLVLPTPHQNQLAFSRSYNGQSTYSGSLGAGWTSSYSTVTLTPGVMLDNISHILIRDASGKGLYFQKVTATRWQGIFKETSHVELINGEYFWFKHDGGKYVFNSNDQLIRLDDAFGNQQTFAYDANNRLQNVNDLASGRNLTFVYNANNLLDHISGLVTAAVTDGIWVSYGYDANSNLTSVTYADGSGFNYEYAAPGSPENETVGDNHNLTAKRDKQNHLISSWKYDSKDRAYDSFNRDGKGVTIDYSVIDAGGNTINVTDAYNVTRTYTLTKYDTYFPKVTAIAGPGGCTTCAGGKPIRYAYDPATLNLFEEEYANGRIDKYANYDSRGNPGTIIQAFGLPEAVSIIYTYHPELNAPLTKTVPSVLAADSKQTVWDYDDDGNSTPNETPTKLVHRLIEKGYTKDALGAVVPYESITTYQYNTKGQVVSIDGPLAGPQDIVSYTYNSTPGDLATITQPLIGTTMLGNYDAAGNPTLITDINGQTTTINYDGRNRAISHSSNSVTVSLSYNQAGDLASQTSGTNATTTYSYDPTSGLLARITDPLNQDLTYDHDSQGNITGIADFTPEAVRRSYQGYSYQYPSLPGKLWKIINFDGNATVMAYDSMGNLSSVTDAANHATTYTYDVLHRIYQVTQPEAAITTHTYDSQNHLKTVTDAEGHVTSFIFDDMGNLLNQTSPDSGSKQHRYDLNGNRIGSTDANGVSATYGYDFLNRLTSIAFPDAAQNIIYTYDQGTNGKGRMTAINDPSGSTSLEYDNQGRLAKEIRNINSKTFTTSYTYDNDNRLSGITYPGGRVIHYIRNAAGQVSKVENVTSTTSTLAANLSYRPFGPLSVMTLGNGLTETRDYDESLRLTSKVISSVAGRTYGYNPDGTVATITDSKDASANQIFSYDGQERLTGATGKYGTLAYSYDKTGNRQSETKAGQSETYSYLTGTHKLQTVTGQTAVAYSHDANGNTTAIGNQAFTYNQNNQLIEAKEAGSVKGQYAYNGLGQRVQKIADGKTTLFVYDKDGGLIAEADETGKMQAEYVHLDGQRLAKFAVNPGEDNLRFPGQYYDAETGLHYNWHRYYDPDTGRYLTPDPIGLAGGINLYSYSYQNPVNYIDPLGLFGDGTRRPGHENPDAFPGHSDFVGGDQFDFTRIDHGRLNPYNPLSTWRHFRNLEDVEKDLAAAIDSCDASSFENYMHQGQDFFSHYDRGYRWYTGGHIKDGATPDQIRWQAWQNANSWTGKKVRRWKDNCGCSASK